MYRRSAHLKVNSEFPTKQRRLKSSAPTAQ